MLKKILPLLLMLALLAGCASAEGARVAALKGPTAMGMVKMMADDAEAQNYDFTIAASADELTPKLVRGELDLAALPANLAAVLYAKTEGQLSVLAINTLGVLYIAERGDSIQSVADLKGKTIYSAGKGSTPEYALNYILTQNGLTPGTDVTIEYKSEHSECLAAILSDESAVAMLPQPFMTTALTKAEDMRIALNLNEEWDRLDNGSALITGVVVARRDYIEQNAEAVDAFLADYAASVEYVNENVADAAQLVGNYEIVTAEVAEQAIPYCNIVFISGSEMKDKLSGYLEVLYQQNPDSVGGSVPDAQFYYGAE